MGWKGWLTALTLLTIAWALPFLLGGALGDSVPSVEGGNPAPGFGAVDVSTGEPATLDDYRGKVVLLNIWATWCEPCKVEMPAMERVYRKLHDDGFEVVAISVDVGSEDAIRDFVDEYRLSFDVLHDREQRVASTYQVFALPQSFVIDRAGDIVYREFGAVAWDGAAYRQRFRDLLGADGEDSR